MLTGIKVVLVFEKAFWEEDKDMFGLLRDSVAGESLKQADYVSRRGRFYLFWNCIKASGRPMLGRWSLFIFPSPPTITSRVLIYIS